MRVAVTHTTRLEYSDDVVEGVMDTRLGPFNDEHQLWDRFVMRVDPLAAVRAYTDGFGNTAHLVTIAGPHRHIEVTTQSEVTTYLDDPFKPPPRAPAPLSASEMADYLAPSALVPAHAELSALAEPHRPARPEDAFASARALTTVVYEGFEYRQDVTDVTTTVADVLAGRTGVCQDFAHLLIGLCRAVGIPARYVSGYIVTQSRTQTQSAPGQSQSQSMAAPGTPRRGAGHSHAWVEAYSPTHGWRGFDPTNDLVASEHHVKMAIGRDYRDVPPQRGTFRGNTEQRLSVRVVAAATA